jgi:hypothetical protein
MWVDISDNPRDIWDNSATFPRSAPVKGDRGTAAVVAVAVITGSFPAGPPGAGLALEPVQRDNTAVPRSGDTGASLGLPADRA